jgi:hypothetical protein
MGRFMTNYQPLTTNHFLAAAAAAAFGICGCAAAGEEASGLEAKLRKKVTLDLSYAAFDEAMEAVSKETGAAIEVRDAPDLPPAPDLSRISRTARRWVENLSANDYIVRQDAEDGLTRRIAARAEDAPLIVDALRRMERDAAAAAEGRARAGAILKAAAYPHNANVSISVKDLPADMALRWICRLAGSDMRLDRDKAVIFPARIWRLPVPPEDDRGRALRAHIKDRLEKRITINIDKVFLGEVLRYNIFSDMNLIVDPAVNLSDSVSVKIDDLTTGDALGNVLSPAGLCWVIADGVVYVCSPETAAQVTGRKPLKSG